MDIFSVAPTSTASEAPKKVFITLNGTAAEFAQLRDALDKALVGGPQVMEARTSIGTDVRIVVDRLGTAVKGN